MPNNGFPANIVSELDDSVSSLYLACFIGRVRFAAAAEHQRVRANVPESTWTPFTRQTFWYNSEQKSYNFPPFISLNLASYLPLWSQRAVTTSPIQRHPYIVTQPAQLSLPHERKNWCKPRHFNASSPRLKQPINFLRFLTWNRFLSNCNKFFAPNSPLCVWNLCEYLVKHLQTFANLWNSLKIRCKSMKPIKLYEIRPHCFHLFFTVVSSFPIASSFPSLHLFPSFHHFNLPSLSFHPFTSLYVSLRLLQPISGCFFRIQKSFKSSLTRPSLIWWSPIRPRRSSTTRPRPGWRSKSKNSSCTWRSSSSNWKMVQTLWD